ncbi:folate family ECF transporter S component [Alkaliphilus peptidifermentans]|uniref:ECF transporter S component, folate family n=1 Tax=Alkaliphilus peptidifermentans DSM 18978 TaxID=1120976 RepID=A0A1G5J393_9FIRM|nr:folate family ECF transporter S component [Alkaliphilus peptidifermentans]SCY82752.1 ECF transporter S component, folate family [Alkaliphilus peptidifermentans DSM 18978]
MGVSQKTAVGTFHSSSKLSTKKLVMASFLSALTIVLTRYGSIMLAGGSIRLGFGNLPIILSGILLGPIAGALTGVVSDLLGVLILSQGGFHPGFTLSAALTGLIPGMIVAFNQRNKYSFLNILMANVLVYLVISLGLNTYWLTQLLGNSFFVLLPARALAQGIVTVITIVLIFFLSKYFKYWDNK